MSKEWIFTSFVLVQREAVCEQSGWWDYDTDIHWDRTGLQEFMSLKKITTLLAVHLKLNELSYILAVSFCQQLYVRVQSFSRWSKNHSTNTVYTKSNTFAWLSDAQEISLFRADTVQVAAGQESVGQWQQRRAGGENKGRVMASTLIPGCHVMSDLLTIREKGVIFALLEAHCKVSPAQ